MKISKIFIVLSIATIICAVLCEINTRRLIAYVEHTGHFPTYPWNVGLFLIVGFVLFSFWVIAGVIRRNIRVIVALVGIAIASFFFMAATTRDIGYSLDDWVWQIDRPGYFTYSLNPFLHLGGGKVICFLDCGSRVALNALSMKNLLYTVYGESISFSLLGIFYLIRRYLLKKHSNIPKL